MARTEQRRRAAPRLEYPNADVPVQMTDDKTWAASGFLKWAGSLSLGRARSLLFFK